MQLKALGKLFFLALSRGPNNAKVQAQHVEPVATLMSPAALNQEELNRMSAYD